MKLSSLVLLTLISVSALAQSKSDAKKIEYINQKSASIALEIQEKYNRPDLLDSSIISEFARSSFAADGYSIDGETANYCIEFEMRKDDERYATAYEVLRDGYAVECLAKNLVPNQK
jgi:hypothetical protein